MVTTPWITRDTWKTDIEIDFVCTRSCKIKCPQELGMPGKRPDRLGRDPVKLGLKSPLKGAASVGCRPLLPSGSACYGSYWLFTNTWLPSLWYTRRSSCFSSLQLRKAIWLALANERKLKCLMSLQEETFNCWCLACHLYFSLCPCRSEHEYTCWYGGAILRHHL